VQDDGHGFDPATVADGHLGLAGMRARAERLGGRFAVVSAPGEGTVVEAVVPEPVVLDVARDGAPRGVGSAGTGRRR
jgi:nitrate/nitrite-specific signal transduction histidine kinase